jgi:hypothetical protein
MPLILQEAPRNVTPTGRARVDWRHPLANGLVACYLPGITMQGLNLAGLGGDLALVSTALAPAVTRDGPAWASTTAANGLKAPAPAAFLANTVSYYWRGVLSSATPDDTVLIGIQFADPETGPFHYASITTQQGALRLGTEWNSGGVHTVGSPFTYTAGFNSIGATFTPGGNANLYSGGVLAIFNTFGASNPSSSATSAIVFQSSTATGGGTRVIPATGNIACIWNRALSADEMALLDGDPYCFLFSDEGEMPALFVSGDAVATVRPIFRSGLRFFKRGF